MGRFRVELPAILIVALLLLLPRFAQANTRSQQHYAKGLIPFQAGQWQSAYASFTNATRADPNDAVALYYRGITGAQLGFLQESIADVEKALEIRPDLREAVLDLGVLYLEAGEYERAEAWLKRAYEIPENRFRAALYLGVTNYRRGNDSAAQEYLAAAAKDPRLRPVANYYQGLSLLRQGNADAAAPLLEASKTAMPGTPVAAAVQEFDAAGGARAVRRAPAAEDGKPWAVYGQAGFAYDSNVKLAPDDAAIQRTRGYGSEDDGRFQFGLGGRYRVVDTEMFTGSIGYELYQGVNFSNSRFDISSHRVRADFATRAASWYQLGVSTYYNYYGRNYKSFYHEGTVVPWVAFYEGDAMATQVYYRLRGQDYTRGPFDPWRDAINNAVGARQHFLLGAVDRVLAVGYQWSDNDPLSRDGTDFAYMTHQFDIELEAAVRDWFDTRLGYALLIDDYEHPNSRTAFEYGRNDAEHQVVIRVERPLTENFTAALDYLGIFNGSNLDEFEYDRNIVSAGVSMHF